MLSIERVTETVIDAMRAAKFLMTRRRSDQDQEEWWVVRENTKIDRFGAVVWNQTAKIVLTHVREQSSGRRYRINDNGNESTFSSFLVSMQPL